MTKRELLDKQAEELARFEREAAFQAAWQDTVSVCTHSGFLSVTYKKQFPSRHSFGEAMEIFNRIRASFDLVTSEHWKDGCLSCRPPEINSNASKARAVMVGTSVVELTISAGKGYQSHGLSFWVRVPNFGLVKVSVEIQPKHQWLPSIQSRQDIHGDYTEWRVSFKGIGEDFVAPWWSPEGSYRRGYYWADVPNFEAWSSHELSLA